MDVLIILLASVLLRVLFRRRDRADMRSQLDAPANDLSGLVNPIVLRAPRQPARRTQCRLLLRALYGVLLAFLCVVFALIPWPVAWQVSSAIAPQVYYLQALIVHNVDMVTIGMVTLAVVEPLLMSCVRLLLKRVFHTLSVITRIAHIFALLAALGYWRVRRNQTQRRWLRCCMTADSSTFDLQDWPRRIEVQR